MLQRGHKIMARLLQAAAICCALLTPALAQAASNWIQLVPGGTPPSFRCFGASEVYDPGTNRAILFGGFGSGCSAPVNDVWVLTRANGLGGAPQWLPLSPTGPAPAPRDNHSAVYDAASNRMIVYGGCEGGCLPVASDVWILTNANGIGGTPQWIPLATAGAPPGRQGHRALYDAANNRMIVFGGQDGGGSPATEFLETWVLSNANGLDAGTPTWTKLLPAGGPPAAAYAVNAIAFDSAHNRLMVFAGEDTAGGFTNAAWVLSNANGLGGAPAWSNLTAQGAPGSPSARQSGAGFYNAAQNALTTAGGQSATGALSDAWQLSGANGLGGAPAWSQLVVNGGSPSGIHGSGSAYDAAANRLLVFSNAAAGSANETWVLSDGAVEAATAGFNSFLSVVNARGASLDYTDLLPFYDANFLNDGDDRIADAKSFASFARGRTLTNFVVTGVNSYDAASGIISLRATVSDGNGATYTLGIGNNNAIVLKRQPDGSYLSYGDQQAAGIDLHVAMRTDDNGPGFVTGPRQAVELNVSAPMSTPSGVTVTQVVLTAGPNVAAPITLHAGSFTDQVEGSPGVFESITRKSFSLPTFDASPVLVAPATYTFQVTFSDGSSAVYTAATGQPVSDTVNGAITVTIPTGHALTDANLSGSLGVQWTLPTAYAVGNVELSTSLQLNNGSTTTFCGDDNATTLNLAGSATSALVTFPSAASCGSGTVGSATVRIRATGLNGEESEYNYQFFASPAVPQNLNGFANQTQAQLHWNTVPQALSYNVYRATAPGGPFSLVGTATTFNGGFLNTSLAPSTTYYYRVTSVNPLGESAPATVSLTTQACTSADCTPPSVPAGVQVTATGARTVTITWNAATDVDDAVASYRVHRCQSTNNSCALAITFTTTQTSYTDTTVAANSTYNYSVSACDTAGNCSLSSNTPNVTTPVGTGDVAPPSPPANLGLVSATTNQVVVAWSLSSDNVGVTSYAVFRQQGTGCEAFGQSNFVGSVLSPPQFSDGTVSPNSHYCYAVAALDAANNFSLSSVLSVDTPGLPGSTTISFPPSIALPNNTVGSPTPTQASVTVQNTGGTNLTLTFTSLAGNDFAVLSFSCFGAPIAPGASCAIPVGFIPLGAGARTGTLSFSSNASGSPHSVALSGTGLSSPATLWIRGNNGFNSSLSVRQGQTASFAATLVQSDGTIVSGVAANWSIVSGPASVNAGGVVTGGAVGANTAATLQAQFTDAALTGGQTLTATFPLTIQASQDHWIAGGAPAPGGDVRGFTFFNNSLPLLAAVYGGGIYRTSDGATWQQSAFGIPFRSSARVRSMRFVGTGQVLAAIEGQGIYRSSDGGSTWSPSNTGMGCNFPRFFSGGSTASPSALYVSTTCGVYKSVDSGNTWTFANLGGFIGSVATVAGTSTVWATTNGQGLWRSTDSGGTWQQMNNGLPSDPASGIAIINLLPFTPNVYLTTIKGAGVYRSYDQGATWQAENSGLPAGPYQFMSGIGGAGDGYLYVLLDGAGIWRGTAGPSGASPLSWSQWGTSATQLPKRANTPTLVNGVYYVPTGEGVFRSSDGGATWTQINGGLGGGFVNNTATDSANPGIAYAAAGTIYKTGDGGTTWSKADSGITGAVNGIRGGLGTVLRQLDGTLYAATGNAGIFKSTNGALTWTAVNSGLPGTIGQGPGLRTHPTNAQTLYAFFGTAAPSGPSGDPLGVFVTTNAGASWTSITGDLSGNALFVSDLRVDPATGYLYVATRAGLFRSVNGGVNWTPVYTASAANYVRLDDGTSPSTLYFSASLADAFGSPLASSGLYRSTDGGSTYSQVLSGKLVANLRIARPYGAPVLYLSSWNVSSALNDAGVLKSTDGGASWQSINAGNANLLTGFIDVLPANTTVNSQVVRMATHGNGVLSFAADTTALPPTAPLGVGATVQPGGNIAMSWSPVAGASAYNIYMANASGVTKANYLSLAGGHVHANVQSPYTHAAAAPGTYYFVVTAVNAAGESVQSEQVTATVTGYTLTASTSGSGTVTSDVGGISCPSACTTNLASGAVVTLTAAPTTGNTFVGWSGACTGTGTCQVTLNANATAVASFVPTAPTLTVSLGGTGSGTVSSAPAGISCPTTCQAAFALQSSVTLTASAGAGSTFAGWSGACSGTGGCTVTMNAALSVTATFNSGSTQSFPSGFTLAGNGATTALNVLATFGTADAPVSGVSGNVDAIWAWDAATLKWMFHTPQFTAAQSAAYAAAHGYEALTSIPPGRGYWVNALAPFSITVPAGAPFNYGNITFGALPAGFNLLAIGGTMTASQFNVTVGLPPSPGQIPNNFNALWAWDTARETWYFYTPSYEQPGAPFTNCQYDTAHHFLDFGFEVGSVAGACAAANNAAWVASPPAPALSLKPGMGFWVDKF